MYRSAFGDVLTMIYLFHRNLCEVGISSITSVPVVLFTDYFWSDWELSSKAFEWELFCSVIFPWIHKHNHNTDDHNTLIYCTYSQSSCLCCSAIWQSNNLCRDSIFWDWLQIFSAEIDFFFLLGCLRNSSPACAFGQEWFQNKTIYPLKMISEP